MGLGREPCADYIRTVDDRMILHRPTSWPLNGLDFQDSWVPQMRWYCICNTMIQSCSSLLDSDPPAISLQPRELSRPTGCCILLLYCFLYWYYCSARPGLGRNSPKTKQGGESAQRARFGPCGGLQLWLSSKQWRRDQGSPYIAISHCGQGPRLGVVPDLAPLFAPSYIHARRTATNSRLNPESLSRHVESSASTRDGKSCARRQ